MITNLTTTEPLSVPILTYNIPIERQIKQLYQSFSCKMFLQLKSSVKHIYQRRHFTDSLISFNLCCKQIKLVIHIDLEKLNLNCCCCICVDVPVPLSTKEEKGQTKKLPDENDYRKELRPL